MYDVIIVGGSTRDFYLICPDLEVNNNAVLLPWGEKKVASEIYREIGGGGCNASVSFSRLGLHCALISKVGNDSSGEEIVKKLRDESVSLQFIEIGSENGTSTSFILQKETGDHSIVMYRGKNDQLLDGTNFPPEFDSTKWYYITDLAVEKNDPTERIVEVSVKKKIKIAFIPGQNQLGKGINGLSKILEHTDILILNAYEAKNLAYPELDLNNLNTELKSLEPVLSKLSEYGAKTVVITADVKGAIARGSDGEFYYVPAPIVDRVVNTVGAGDAFASTFVAGIIKGKSIRESLIFATKNVGEVLKNIGSQSGLLKTKL